MSALLRILAWLLAIALVALPVVAVLNGWVGAERWPLTRLRVHGEFKRVPGEDLRRALLPYARAGYFAVKLQDAQHAVERVRQLFAMALAYDLPEGIGNYGLDLERLQLPPAAPYVVFLHGTTWATKHWPEAYWRELAERMGRRKLEVRLPWGNPAEKARAERIAQGLNNCQVLPKLNLAGVARVLAAAKACVAVDTGLGHLAAALDVPTISLFGPTNPGLTGAYGRTQIHQASDWPCAPCLQKKCTYKPSADDLRRFDLKREWPLCFTRLNPEHVASRLSALLLAEDVR